MMKKKVIFAALLVAASGSGFAQGFDLTYSGTLTHVGCIIDPASSSVAVDFGDKNVAEISGSTARSWDPFKIQLINCAPNQVVFGAFSTTHGLNAGKNKLTATGTATNVGMKLRYADATTGNMTTVIFDGAKKTIGRNKTALASDVELKMDAQVEYLVMANPYVTGTAMGSASLVISY